jgi:integrase
MRVLSPIWKTRTETASRVRGRIENILAWATVQGYRTGDNPARWRGHLDKLLAERTKVAKVRHQPALHYDKVPEFMVELRDNGSISARALEFTILTAARTHNTIGATWAQVDLEAKTWTIAGEEMKGEKGKHEDKRLHRVPLSDRAVEILEGMPRLKGNPHVFVGAQQGKGLSNMAMLELLKGMRPGLTVHGFRSSFRDWAAERTSFPRELAEKALGHVVGNKVEAAYQRGDLLEKRRRLMEAWAGYCAKPEKKVTGAPAPVTSPVTSKGPENITLSAKGKRGNRGNQPPRGWRERASRASSPQASASASPTPASPPRLGARHAPGPIRRPRRVGRGRAASRRCQERSEILDRAPAVGDAPWPRLAQAHRRITRVPTPEAGAGRRVAGHARPHHARGGHHADAAQLVSLLARAWA